MSGRQYLVNEFYAINMLVGVAKLVNGKEVIYWLTGSSGLVPHRMIVNSCWL